MRLLNVALGFVTLLAYVGSYLQEKKRLAIMATLPPAEALARYEAAQKRRERFLAGVTALLTVGGLVALALRLRR